MNRIGNRRSAQWRVNKPRPTRWLAARSARTERREQAAHIQDSIAGERV